MFRSPALLVALVLSATCGRLEALDPGKPLTSLGLASWQRELPQSTVHAVLQTRDGYVWAGTWEGLVRFDGVAFKVFDRRNTKELGTGVIFALFEDRAGSLWIGTRGSGAVRLRDGRFRRYGREEGLPNEYVTAFCEDGAGRLWVGTNAGLARLAGDLFEPVPNIDPHRVQTQGLAADREGAVWISTEGGVLRWQAGTTSRLSSRDRISSKTTAPLVVDRSGAVWIGTDDGVSRIASGGTTVYGIADGLAAGAVRALLADREGSVWVGTEGGGLSRIRGGRAESFGPRDGLPSGMVRSLCEDAEGSLWIGTNGGGLVCLKDQKVATYGARHGLADENVRAVLEDRAGTVWIGTDGGGLYALKDGRATRFQDGGVPGDYVRSLAEAPDGALWVGTIGSGLVRIVNGRATKAMTGELSDAVSLLATKDGTLWLGTDFRGLSRLANGVLTRETSREALAARPITSFLEDSKGATWIASNGAGIARWRAGSFERIGREQGLPSDRVYGFHEDDTGAVWIGTDSGIARWKNGRAATVTSAQGLFDDLAFQILEDGHGRFWITCNRGIYRVDRRALENVLDGRARSVTSTVYGISDGMGTSQCNGASQPPAWKSRDGRLWFATVHGLSVVDPERIPMNRRPPPVLVEEVIANGVPLDVNAPARLRPGVEKLEIHYTATSFLAPERVRFRFRLEGYDKSWTEAGTRRVAYYTGLPPGRFRFRVLACNDDGVWNEAGASFLLELLPPWWRTWWAQVLEALALVLALFGVVRLRVRALERRTAALERKVEERTVALAASERRASEANRAKSVFLASMSHELRTPLNGILGFAQLMARRRGRDAEDKESLDVISRSGEHLLGLINDVLSLSKIEAGRVELSVEAFDPSAFVRALLGVVSPRAAAKRLELAVETHGLPPAVRGDEAKLRQILLNLLSNAVRLTAAGRVTLRAGWSGGRGVFEVEDTGPGISPDDMGKLFQPFTQTEAGMRSQEGTGLGLALSRQLARLMGGDVTVVSAVGKGAAFRLEVELPEADAASVRGLDTRRVASLAPGTAAPRVLVVDDLAENRLVLTRLLVSVGFDVREAAGGEQAVEAWRSVDPRLVFMDKRMAGVDGLEATRRIRAEERATGRPYTAIVALTASAMEHERGEILASGCDAFIAKPYRESAIFETIAQLVGTTYVYDGDDGRPSDPAATIEAARLARIPQDVREELLDAFSRGDFDAAERAAQRVRPLDEVLAEALHAAARRYDSDAALAALAGADRREPGGPS